MATHSSIVALRIPWTEEPGWLWFIVLQRVRHDWSNLACTPKTKLKSHFLWGLLCWLFCTVTFLVTPTVIIAYVSHLALILSFDIAYTTILTYYLTLYVCLFWVPTCDGKSIELKIKELSLSPGYESGDQVCHLGESFRLSEPVSSSVKWRL